MINAGEYVFLDEGRPETMARNYLNWQAGLRGKPRYKEDLRTAATFGLGQCLRAGATTVVEIGSARRSARLRGDRRGAGHPRLHRPVVPQRRHVFARGRAIRLRLGRRARRSAACARGWSLPSATTAPRAGECGRSSVRATRTPARRSCWPRRRARRGSTAYRSRSTPRSTPWRWSERWRRTARRRSSSWRGSAC